MPRPGVVLCLASAAAFGAMGILGKLAYDEGASVGTLLATRFVLAAAVFWLLLLGHSFYLLGGLALPAFRGCGLLYQAAGLVALWPGGWGLEVFAGAMLVGNLGLAWAVWRERRQG